MSPNELATRQRRALQETLVISEIEEGFRVFSPANPANIYVVAGTPDNPTCTCPDFEVHRADPDWRCKHILAVMPQAKVAPVWRTRSGNGADGPDTYEAEERAAIQAESGGPTRRRRTVGRPGNGPAAILVKRSVSPDGRIDSLSVEFSSPVDNVPPGEIQALAGRFLGIQAGIIERFRNGSSGTTPETPQAPRPEPVPESAVPAKLLDVGGMNGKWGRRLFVNVETDGRTLKLFGSKKQLGEHVTAAGFPQMTEQLEEGTRLDLPCRVTTKPTDDGKYLNIENVYPVLDAGATRGARR